MVRDVAVRQRLAAVFQRIAHPAVAAQNRHLHAQLARLAHDDGGFRIIARHEDRIGLLAAHLRENGLEVGVARAVAHRIQHLPAERGEMLLNGIGEAD